MGTTSSTTVWARLEGQVYVPPSRVGWRVSPLEESEITCLPPERAECLHPLRSRSETREEHHP